MDLAKARTVWYRLVSVHLGLRLPECRLCKPAIHFILVEALYACEKPWFYLNCVIKDNNWRTWARPWKRWLASCCAIQPRGSCTYSKCALLGHLCSRIDNIVLRIFVMKALACVLSPKRAMLSGLLHFAKCRAARYNKEDLVLGSTRQMSPCAVSQSRRTKCHPS